MEVLTVVGEGGAANLTEYVDCLLRLKCLCVDNIDEIGFLHGDEHALAAPHGGEAQAAGTRHLGPDGSDGSRSTGVIGPLARIPYLHRTILAARSDGPSIIGPVAGESAVAVALEAVKDLGLSARVSRHDRDVRVIADHDAEPSIRRNSGAVDGRREPDRGEPGLSGDIEHAESSVIGRNGSQRSVRGSRLVELNVIGNTTRIPSDGPHLASSRVALAIDGADDVLAVEAPGRQDPVVGGHGRNLRIWDPHDRLRPAGEGIEVENGVVDRVEGLSPRRAGEDVAQLKVHKEHVALNIHAPEPEEAIRPRQKLVTVLESGQQ